MHQCWKFRENKSNTCQYIVLTKFGMHGQMHRRTNNTSVWYCHIPGHGLPSCPRQKSGPIRLAAVIQHQTDWFLDCWHLCLLKFTPWDHSDGCDAVILGSFCGRRDCASHVYPSTHNLSIYNLWGSQALHPRDRFIWQPQLNCSYGWCIQPITQVWRIIVILEIIPQALGSVHCTPCSGKNVELLVCSNQSIPYFLDVMYFSGLEKLWFLKRK